MSIVSNVGPCVGSVDDESLGKRVDGEGDWGSEVDGWGDRGEAGANDPSNISFF